jgi:hypothetical protein
MLDEVTISRVAKHEVSHQLGMCTCPCFDALMEVGDVVKREGELRIALAKASPEALAAITLAGENGQEEEEVTGEPESLHATSEHT